MAEPAFERMDLATFLKWHDRQPSEERYELVHGRPRLMVRPVIVHQLILKNTCIALDEELQDGPCFSVPEILIEVSADTYRIPDVSVLCDRDEIGESHGEKPVVLMEVLSPSTLDVDLYEKHEEYRGLASVKHFAFLSADRAQVALWSVNDDGAWTVETFEGLDTAVPMPAIGVTLPLSRLYRDTGLE